MGATARDRQATDGQRHSAWTSACAWYPGASTHARTGARSDGRTDGHRAGTRAGHGEGDLSTGECAGECAGGRVAIGPLA